MKVEVIRNYRDLEFAREVKAGEMLVVETRRAIQLLNAGLVREVVEEVGLGLTELANVEPVKVKRPRKKKE